MLEIGARLEQRTANIQPISVTLDVLRNNGWLNARASCQKNSMRVVRETRASAAKAAGGVVRLEIGGKARTAPGTYC